MRGKGSIRPELLALAGTFPSKVTKLRTLNAAACKGWLGSLIH
jgi:hypothetical protein